ncbi:MAG TPA: hypothetical protein VMG10_03010 [Gemmataceae bacterium]|nr:hypothetical protein [Gemmataceae bacterium]
MKRVASTFVLAGFVLLGSHAFGAKDDTVFFREPGKKMDQKIIGKILEESPSGIKVKPLKGEDKKISPLDITQIEYGAASESSAGNVAATDFRSPDGKLVRALAEPPGGAKRADGLRAALLGFQTLDAKESLQRLAPVHRYLQFRIAQTLYYQALADASRLDAAITALKDYKSKYADGWEIVPALQSLASLQEGKGDIDAASQTYTDLAALDGINPAMKLQSQLKGARLMMLVNKFADAEKQLKDVANGLSANDPQRTFVEAYLIQSRIAQKGNLDGVDTKLQQILRSSKDASLLALVHNSLGDLYRSKGNFDQAFWEYCKVDMLYNQDKEEHAKALFYLSKFSSSRRAKIAGEALTRLKTTQFDGTLFQRQAMAEKKSAE